MVARVRQASAEGRLVDEALARAAIGERYEVIDGKLVEMTPTGFEHGAIERRIGQVLGDYVDNHQLGEVVVGGVVFRVDPEGRLARAVDVAFVRRERLLPPDQARGAFDGAPDLVVEVVSPDDLETVLQQKVDDWLKHGTQAVLVVYPETSSIILWQPNRGTVFRRDDEVDLSTVLPGFRVKVNSVFPSRFPRTAGSSAQQ